MAASSPDTESLTRRLTSAGVKPSANRLAVLAELAAEPDDATAQVIHRRLAGGDRPVGLATVYRALRTLSDAGVVDALPHGSTETCYRLCGLDHHHHLVCKGCHRVVELRGCPAERWAEREAGKNGFVVTGHQLEVSGLCATCRQAA